MQTRIELLSSDLISRVLDEAFQLMMNPGIKVLSPRARDLLADGGAIVDRGSEVVQIPEKTARAALQTVPSTFYLFDRLGQAKVTYGGNTVQFDPGSSAVHVLDPDTRRTPFAEDGRSRCGIIKVAEMLPQYDAQSTAVVCDDVPKAIGDLYRLYVVLMYSVKPVVTGSFSNSTLQAMIDMLALFAGDRQRLADRPAGRIRRVPVAAPHLERVRCGESDVPGRSADARRNRFHAAGRRRFSCHSRGHHHPARGRMYQRHHHPPAGASRITDRLGRCSGNL